MEDKNMARVELNEQDIDQVVGGAFHFYTNQKTGEKMCVVDGFGLYKATAPTSVTDVITMCANNPTKTQQELLDMAVGNGYITKP